MRSRYIEGIKGNAQPSPDGTGKWSFGQVAEVVEQSWIIWVLRRMQEAVEEKVRYLLRH